MTTKLPQPRKSLVGLAALWPWRLRVGRPEYSNDYIIESAIVEKETMKTERHKWSYIAATDAA
jgi:hypothetical protein